jgi:hypothetical protein
VGVFYICRLSVVLKDLCYIAGARDEGEEGCG